MMTDLSYLRSEYARNKSIEQYNMEAKPLDDGEQQDNTYPAPDSGNNKPDGKKALAGVVVAPVSEERTA